MKSLLQSTLLKDPDQTPGLEDKLQSTFPFVHSFPPGLQRKIQRGKVVNYSSFIKGSYLPIHRQQAVIGELEGVRRPLLGPLPGFAV